MKREQVRKVLSSIFVRDLDTLCKKVGLLQLVLNSKDLR